MKLAGQILYTLTVIVGLGISAQAETSSVHSSLGSARLKTAYFYEVSLKGKTSYILGTMHVGITLDELPEVVTSKFNSARALYVEKKISPNLVEMTLKDSQTGYITMMKSRNERQGMKRSPLTVKEKEILKSFFHLPSPVVEVMRCPDVISYFFFNGNYTFPMVKSLDYSILNQAYKKELPTYELDTDQMRQYALEASLRSQQEKSVATNNKIASTGCDLKDQLKGREVFNQARDTERLLVQYKAGKLKSSDDKFVTIRNLMWIENESFLNDLAKGNTYVAVGAYHLLGPKGILRGLQAKGFTVKRLP